MTRQGEPARRRLPARFWPVVFPGVVACGMALFMACVITALNTGIDAGFPVRWAKSFAIAFPIAWVVAIFWAPIARKIALRYVDPPQG